MTETAEGFVVRPAGPADARSFLMLWRSVVGERTFVRSDAVHGSVRTFRKRFRSSWTNEEANLVAVHGDRVIGHLSVSREEHPVTRHVASLGMAVAPEWRGGGGGSAPLAGGAGGGRGDGGGKRALPGFPGNQPPPPPYPKFRVVPEGRGYPAPPQR